MVLSHWTGRIDAEDGAAGRRWHQLIRDLQEDSSVPETGRSIAFVGFPVDEGVRRNQGRPGAAQGPAVIRRACASLPDHFPAGTALYEAGDVGIEGDDLQEAQAVLGRKTAALIGRGLFPVVLGGGHEVAWGTFQGVLAAAPAGARPGILNVDAHFDLRRPVDGPTSGTGFYQMAEACRERELPFRYCCLGIQRSGNTRALFERADSLGVQYHLSEALSGEAISEVERSARAFVEASDLLYLSIDLDAFHAGYAPGVSAPNALGLTPRQVLPLLRSVMASGKVAILDIAELNPAYDIDGRTARLAASLLFELLTPPGTTAEQ